MKHIFRLCIVTIFVAFVLQTQAQVKFGIKAGLNADNISQNYKDSDMESATNMRLAYHIGAIIDYGFNDILSLHTGLLLISKGYSWDLEEDFGNDAEVDGYFRANYNYLEVPFNFVYKMSEFQVYVGPYCAIGIGGIQKWDYIASWTDGELGDDATGDYNLKPVFGEVMDGDFDNSDEGPYRALDYGVNFGIGYQLGPVLVNAGYSHGLGNVVPEYEGDDAKDYKISNRVITISASYFLKK